MLEQLKALCCFNEDYQISINVELMNCKGFNNTQKNLSGTDTIKWKHKISPSREILVDFSDYSFHIMIDFNRGSIEPETDFLYIREDSQPVPDKIDLINTSSVIIITENKFNECAGYCQFSLSNIDPTKTYTIHYMRKNVRKNIVNSFYQTKRFKLSFKNKMHNIFVNSINPLTEEFTLIYENDPLFDRFDPSEIIKNHRRSLSLAFTGELDRHSFKTRGSSKDSRFDEKPKTQGYLTAKNSLYNTFISGSEFNVPLLSGPTTNKNSFAGENFHSNHKILKFDNFKTIAPIPEQRVNRDNVNNNNNNDLYQSHEEFNSETMIIHDHKENDDLASKFNVILSENLGFTYPPLGDLKDVSQQMEKTDKLKFNKSKKPSMENSKIFDLLRSQERKDFNFQSSGKLKLSPDRANISVSPESIKKEFQIGSSSKKRKYEMPPKLSGFNANKVEKNIINLLEEIDRHDDSKKSSPYKENPVQTKKMKESVDLENLHAEFNGQTISNQKAQRKPLQDISNKAIDFSLNNQNVQQIRFNHIITSEDSEKNLIAHTEHSNNSDSKDKENCPPDLSKVTFRRGPKELDMKIDIDNEIDLYCTEDINKATPRYSEIDFKNYYSPNHTDRLHTVEEVCSSSKESSNGGEYPFKSFNRSTSKREPLTSSVRAITDQPVVNEIDELCDNSRVSIPSGSDRSFTKDNDLPIEAMILKKKLDDLGMRTRYDPINRIVKIYYGYNDNDHFLFHWYENTSEKDLNLYFREIVDTVQSLKRDM